MHKKTHSEITQERYSEQTIVTVQRHPVVLICDNVRSLYNVGSLFRTADSACIQEIILCGYTPFPPRKEIEKTALGADKTVPWKYFEHATDAIAYARTVCATILAVELAENSISYTELATQSFPLGLVVGNEVSGVQDSVLSLCDGAVEIPMYGVKHSLNVSVAAGIVLYAAVAASRE